MEWVVVEWVAVENLRSAELHCQYRALSLFPLFSPCLSHSFISALSYSLYFSLSLFAGMKLSLLVAGRVTRCVGVPSARYERNRSTGEHPHARIYTPGVSAACLSLSHRCRGGRVCGVATMKTRPTHPSCRDSVGLLAPRYMDEFGQAVLLLRVDPRTRSCRTASRSFTLPRFNPFSPPPPAPFLRAHHDINQKWLSISLG